MGMRKTKTQSSLLIMRMRMKEREKVTDSLLIFKRALRNDFTVSNSIKKHFIKI